MSSSQHKLPSLCALCFSVLIHFTPTGTELLVKNLVLAQIVLKYYETILISFAKMGLMTPIGVSNGFNKGLKDTLYSSPVSVHSGTVYITALYNCTLILLRIIN